MTAQFVPQEAIDIVVDGAAGVAELLPRVAATCQAEDATVALTLEVLDSLIADVWNGTPVEGGRTVSSTPRLDRMRDYALRNASGAAEREYVSRAYAEISEHLTETCAIIGLGLTFAVEQYQQGVCLRTVLRSSAMPNVQEVEMMLDRLEALAERRQAWEGVKKAIPWVLSIGAVGVVSWLVFGKKR